jgi:urease accessory protein
MRGGSARQSVELVVAAGAVLEYFPGLAIPFRDADFGQQLRLVVAEGATAIIAEIITPGRLAHGERFAYRRCHSSISVERPGGETLYHEAFSLEPGLRTITGPGQMGEAGVLATLVAVGGELSSVEALRQVDGALLDEAATATAALPNGDGLVVKLLTADIMAARDALRRAWTVVRRRTLGADPPIDRRR